MPRTPVSRFLMLSLSVAALSACSDSGSSAKTAAPMPPISEMDAAMNAPAPQPLGASDTLTPVMPVAAAPATTTTSVSTTTTASGASAEARIAALEQTVSALRNDYNKIMPAFASLNTTNERIQTLLDGMEGDVPPASRVTRTTTTTSAASNKVLPAAGTVSSANATAPSVSAPPLSSYKTQPSVAETEVTETVVETVKTTTAPEIAPPVAATTATTTTTTTAVTKAPAPAVQSAASGTPTNSVTALRIGEHGAKTRMVFDLTAKTKPEFKYDLDNGEKILMVELPTSVWTAGQSGKPNSPLISGWTVQPNPSGGATIAVQLKKDARILSTEFLKPEGKDSGRLVMDIAAN